jgi:hypothetical protein
MEVKEFRDSRTQKLSDFQTQYTALKTEYSRLLLAAIQEQDSAKQQDLVQQLLSLNAEMSSQLREILGELNKGSGSFDPKTLNQLTEELIEYQKQYSEIEKGKDRVVTLKLIQGSTKEKLTNAQSMYYFYLFALVILCFLIVFLIIRAGTMTTIGSVVSSVTSGPIMR